MEQSAGIEGSTPWKRLSVRLARKPEMGALIGFLVVLVGFAIFAPYFLTLNSLSGILTVAAELGIVAAGVTFLMISGEFDLSAGSLLGVGAMAFAWFVKNWGWPHLPAFVVALLLTTLAGTLNGLLVVRTGVPSFIITLGAMMVWRGTLLAVTRGFPISIGESSGLLFALGGRFAGGFHMSAFWFLGIIGLLSVVLHHTDYGNGVFATGGAPDSARAMGINVSRTKVLNFALVGLLSGLAGIIQFSRFLSVDPLRGAEWEMQTITAAAIGGTLLTGGYGSILGTFLGVLTIAMVRTGLVLAGAPTYYYRAFIGVILVFAVVFNTVIRGKVQE